MPQGTSGKFAGSEDDARDQVGKLVGVGRQAIDRSPRGNVVTPPYTPAMA